MTWTDKLCDEDTPAELRTCPQYYLHDPDVIAVWSSLGDYRRGTLGPVGLLPAPLVDYLRALDNGHRDWEQAMQLEGAG